MYVCEYCDSECYSASALLACEEQCARETKQSREYFRSANPNRKD